MSEFEIVDMPDFLPLIRQTENCLNGIPVFVPDLKDSVRGMKQTVLRQIFRPLVISLLDRKDTDTSSLASPEDIIEQTSQSLKAPEYGQIVDELTAPYRTAPTGEQPRDWIAEAGEITLSLASKQDHPLLRLGTIVKGTMSSRAKAALTAGSLQSA